MKASRVTNERSGMKRHERQRRIVERFPRFRISGKEDLKSAIELKSFDTIRADTPPNAVGRFKDRARETSVRQATRAGQSGKAGTDNQHIGSCSHDELFHLLSRCGHEVS
jgi:hypothetical protein